MNQLLIPKLLHHFGFKFKQIIPHGVHLLFSSILPGKFQEHGIVIGLADHEFAVKLR